MFRFSFSCADCPLSESVAPLLIGLAINGILGDRGKAEMFENERKEYEKLLRDKYHIQKDRRMYDPKPPKDSLLNLGKRE